MEHRGAAGLWSDLKAAKALSANGYQRLPSGLVMQWGTQATSSGTATVTFPQAFATACVSVTANPVLAGVGTGTAHTAFILTTSLTGATIAVRNITGLTTAASTAPVMWVALGY